jgi:transposase InsO family protein
LCTRQIIGLTQEQLARQSHSLHHQNSNSFKQQVAISSECASQIRKTYPECPQFLNVPHNGVNPLGLIPNQLWQMDATNISDFGKLKYAHMTIDTFSVFLIKTALSGETTKNVVSYCLHYFFMLGVPNQIKTDTRTGYYSEAFKIFCRHFNITHITVIPYNPQGQGTEEL